MRLIIKQKVFSWTDRFRVWDEDGHDRYYVEGEFFSFGKRLHITNPDGQEVALVQQKIFSFLPRFFVWVDGVQVAEIVKEFTFLHQRYTIDGLGWEIEGDFFAHDYTIFQKGLDIITIHKEWLTWGDCYVLDIADSQDTVTALAVVLAIDEEAGQVVGFVNALSDGVLSAFIPLLEVLPEYQGRSVGSELVQRMLAQLSDLYAVDLLCDAEVQPFYARLGMSAGQGMMLRRYDRQSGASPNQATFGPT